MDFGVPLVTALLLVAAGVVLALGDFRRVWPRQGITSVLAFRRYSHSG